MIANGYTYALEYHKTSDRIDEILEIIGVKNES